MFFPYPELFIYPYLRNIGLTPYSQIFDQHFPGFMFLPINLANIGFNTPQSMFVLHLAVIVLVHLLIFFITYSLAKDFKKALIANLFFLIWQPYLEGNVLWIDSFIPLLLLPSSLAFYKQKYRLSGILLGLALVMKQVVAPIAVILGVYLLLYKKFTSLKNFAVWFSLPAIIMCLYFMSIGVWRDFIYWTVTYNLTVFAEMGRKFATRNELIKFTAIFMPSIIFSIYLLFRRISLSVFALFFFGSLIFAYARFDFVHLQPALPFAAIIFSYFISKLPEPVRREALVTYFAIIMLLVAPYHQSIHSNDIKFFSDYEYSIASVVERYSDPNDPIFTFGGTQHIYYLTNTRPSGNIFVFQFPWFMKVAEGEVLEALLSDPPRVVIRDTVTGVDNMNLVSYMPYLNAFISQNYTLVDKIGDTEILIPNESRN